MEPKTITIDPLSAVSLHVETWFDNVCLSFATGFIIERDGSFYLVTNWHVFSGRHPKTLKPLSKTSAIPNKIRVWYHVKDRVGNWVAKTHDLLDKDGKELWVSRDFKGEKIDIAVLGIQKTDDIIFYPLDTKLESTDIVISPSEPVSIIGFPGGQTSDGKFPIWKTGHVASDIGLDYSGKPIFLIDATTKPGMSGSPVLAKRVGMITTSEGIKMGGQATKFMGVYSGRVSDDEAPDSSNLGQVWKPHVIDSFF